MHNLFPNLNDNKDSNSNGNMQTYEHLWAWACSFLELRA